MKNTQKQLSLKFKDEQLGPLPMDRLKHVDAPTTSINNNIQRIDCRENAIAKAARGDYGPEVQQGASIFTVKYPLSAAQLDVVLHLASIKKNEISASRALFPDDPGVLSRHIKRLGYFLKADIVGICRLPQYAIYSHDIQGNPIDIDYEFAIIIVMRKEYNTVESSTGTDWIGDPISYQAYQHLALVTETIANYIRRLGFSASAQHPPTGKEGGFQVLMPPLLLWAGIGEVCRAGIILNPFLGISLKSAAVLTNLPLVPDKPIDFGLQDFCRRCKICALACPSNAIPTGNKIMYNGYETWKLNEQRCASFMMLNKKGTVCNKCVKVCPWTRPLNWPHNLVRWGVEHSNVVRKVAIIVDNILDRKKTDTKYRKEKWWFDLEEIDGVLRIPI